MWFVFLRLYRVLGVFFFEYLLWTGILCFSVGVILYSVVIDIVVYIFWWIYVFIWYYWVVGEYMLILVDFIRYFFRVVISGVREFCMKF